VDDVGVFKSLSLLLVGKDEAEIAATDELTVVVEGGGKVCVGAVVEEGGSDEGALLGKRFWGRQIFGRVRGEGSRGGGEGRGKDYGEFGETGVEMAERNGGGGGAVGAERGPVITGGQVLDERVTGLRTHGGGIGAGMTEEREGESTKSALLLGGVGGSEAALCRPRTEVKDGSVKDMGWLGVSQESTERGSLSLCRKHTVEQSKRVTPVSCQLQS